jgi:predicted amidohydrolase
MDLWRTINIYRKSKINFNSGNNMFIREKMMTRSFIIFILSGLNLLIADDPDKSKLRLAGLQMDVTKNLQKNKSRILKGIKQAAEGGADFLITPEGSLSGYHSQFNQEELDNALHQIEEYAKEYKIGLFLGTCCYEKIDGKDFCYNQIRVYSANGDFIGAHSKILRCSSLDRPGTGEMTEYVQGSLKTYPIDGINYGVLICNDLWATPGYTTISNPYLPWKLKQLGAEIIIHCINSGSHQRYRNFHESSVELWAFHLGLPIVEVNASKGAKKINAQSGMINSKGEREVNVPDQGEQLFYCEIILKK